MIREEEEKEILTDYFIKEKKDTKKKIKKVYIKKWLENILIFINTLIFCFIACINDFNFKGFIILLILILIFCFNALIINKYGRILKELED